MILNIFFLDYDPKLAAKYHCDQHVNKMILESAQMLSIAHHHRPSDISSELPLYKYSKTWVNHPCSKWVRLTRGNYDWLCELCFHLNEECKERYGHERDHLSYSKIIVNLTKKYPNCCSKNNIVTPPFQCVKEQYKNPNNPVKAYRDSYIYDKSEFATWNYSQKPYWYVRRD